MNYWLAIAMFVMGMLAMFGLLEIIQQYTDYRKHYQQTEYVVRWLSLYEKELTILALAQRKKGERKNANPNP